jgi:type I restriction enzyme R subunit
MLDLPSFQEDHISQIPALQLLQNLGYKYLSPAEALQERKNKKSNVILDNILENQLKKLNKINFKGKKFDFSEINIKNAIQSIKDFPYDGLVRTSEKVYDLISLGKSFEQNIEGDIKSFNLNYIDWFNHKNNVFHVTEEFEVERTGSNNVCRPDIILFINGIPFAVIECKRPDLKDSIDQSISQSIRNQHDDHIPKLFIYTSLIMAVSTNQAMYATTGTAAKFWSVWNERENISGDIKKLINKPLSKENKNKLFGERFAYVRKYFDNLETHGERKVTEQDKAIYSLCKPERLLELTYQFIVFDAGEKKIARYQQYFAIKNTIERIKTFDPQGIRHGGIIWHTQGSGKSLTMVMMAKAIALELTIENPRIVLVTDRVDLDEQIFKTFHQCGKDPVQAQTGNHLIELAENNKEAIITTIIDKFEAAVKKREVKNNSNNIFVLVDESHRSNYGSAHVNMRKVFPKACYIGFTGTPLMKKDKNTAQKFGGIIDKYTIDQAVNDKSVLPLLYEGRHALQDVNQKPIDKWFDKVAEPLTEYQKSDLKKKSSNSSKVYQSEQTIQMISCDISEHFKKNWQSTGFKGQLVAPSKDAALKYKMYLDNFGDVSSEVLISPPDAREGYEDIYEEASEEVAKFWKKMMDKYGSEKEYNKQIINSFKYSENPEIIIVVYKLLTGFDAPKNVVLYLTRKLDGVTLLQAIARVNRLSEGKDFGYIIDYCGVLENLDKALTDYSSLSEFDQEDLTGTLTNVKQEIKTLPQKHSELWDIFKDIKNKMDEETYEQTLGDEYIRQKFYDKLSAFSRVLSIAFSTLEFSETTLKETIEKYKADLKFFQKLRISVKLRYAEGIDYKEYEPKIQKLIDTYVTSDEILQIIEPVNIFDREAFSSELEKLGSTLSKADAIANRTKRTITEKMEEDPAFYTKFSKLLERAIEEYMSKRISDTEYFKKVADIMNSVRNRTGDDLPDKIKNKEIAKAFYGITNDVLKKFESETFNSKEISADIAIRIDQIIEFNLVVDWTLNTDIQNRMLNDIEEYLFSIKGKYDISLELDSIDLIMERVLNIARNRYYR